jgi:hypothetical protein
MEEGETEEAYVIRTAQVLHQEGLSANHPDDVIAQYDEQDVVPEVVEGESQEDYDARAESERGERHERNQQRREEATQARTQEREDRQEERKALRAERGEPEEGEQEEEAQPETNNRRSRRAK